MNGSLRTPDSRKIYEDLMAAGTFSGECPLCKKSSLKSFTCWRIIGNDYPYDRIADRHDMILPIRHAALSELTQAEWTEYNELKHTYIGDNYEYLMESTAKRFSIPGHFHVHLVTIKDD